MPFHYSSFFARNIKISSVCCLSCVRAGGVPALRYSTLSAIQDEIYDGLVT